MLAFNTIGYQSSNFLFNAVDALLGRTTCHRRVRREPADQRLGLRRQFDARRDRRKRLHHRDPDGEDQRADDQHDFVARRGAGERQQHGDRRHSRQEPDQLDRAGLRHRRLRGGRRRRHHRRRPTGRAIHAHRQPSGLFGAAKQRRDRREPASKYVEQIKQGYQFTTKSGVQMVTPGTVVYDDQNGKYYVFLGTLNDQDLKPVSIDLGDQPICDLELQSASEQGHAGLGAVHGLQQARRSAACSSDLPSFAHHQAARRPGHGLVIDGGRRDLRAQHDHLARRIAYESGAALDRRRRRGAGAFGGGVTITATNKSDIVAKNTARSPSSDGSPGRPRPSPGTGLAVNAIIATNNILDSAQAFGLNGSVTTRGDGGAVAVAATSNASIDAENNASTDAKIDVGRRRARLQHHRHQAAGRRLPGEHGRRAVRHRSRRRAAGQGLRLSQRRHGQRVGRRCGQRGRDVRPSPSKINNAETGLFSSGVSVAATVSLNRIATDVEAWVTRRLRHRDKGDIDHRGRRRTRT